MTTNQDPSVICCPEFDPVPWDDKTVIWDNKKFIRDRVCTIFYMPVNFGKVMKRMNEKAAAAAAIMPDGLCLSDHTSKWNMDMFLAVDREIANAENTTLTGKFYGKVYEGPFRDTAKWISDYKNVAGSKGFSIKQLYMWYTTCPKCAKKYGKNYVVILSQVE
jgi:hypothetical protein